MRRQGPLTVRHVAVAVLVMVVINAQLTWWILFALRQSRDRLDLERSLLEGEARIAAAEVARRLDRALLDLATAAAAGRADAPPAFSEVRVEPGPCRSGWSGPAGGALAREPVGARCAVGVPDRAWLDSLLPAGERLEAAPPDPSLPGVGLPEPFSGLEIRPSRSAWGRALADHRRRVLMMVSEGSTFAVLLLVVVWLLWKTVRREVELERQHQNFLSAITHELKSPLASMRLSLETVLRGRAEAEATARFLTNALQDTERLQSLVQKVLEVTRYGPSGRALDLRTGNLTELVEHVVAVFRRRATAAGVRLEADLEPEVWAPVDEEAFPIVVSNLLENAIKYGGTIPEVKVRLFVAGDRAVLEVTDNGPGIAEADLPFIFNRFFRGGDELRRTAQGTGLGLYLVRQIVLGHGGKVEVARTGPGGTTFRVELPGAQRYRREDAEELA